MEKKRSLLIGFVLGAFVVLTVMTVPNFAQEHEAKQHQTGEILSMIFPSISTSNSEAHLTMIPNPLKVHPRAIMFSKQLSDGSSFAHRSLRQGS